MSGLTPEQVDKFYKDGFLILPDELSKETVEGLLRESKDLLENFDLDSHPKTRFSTGGEDGKDHVGDDYFLNSGDKIRFFFEEDAFDAQGNLTKPKARAINKIGHALHMHSEPFKAVSMTPRNRAIAASLGTQDPRVLQSMVICKQPEIGGAVPSHQDSTFLYTDPPSAVGFWYALEDCTQENGCLSFERGSHATSPVKERFVRAEGGGTKFEPLPEGKGNGLDSRGVPGGWEVGEVKAGTLVLIHGTVNHRSERNLSQKSRFIYTFHVISGKYEYDEKNWLQPTGDGFSRLDAVE